MLKSVCPKHFMTLKRGLATCVYSNLKPKKVTQGIENMSRGAPHQSTCPYEHCQRIFNNLTEAVAHLVRNHLNSRCPEGDEENVDSRHCLTCTLNVTAQCGICHQSYMMKYEKAHFARHVSK